MKQFLFKHQDKLPLIIFLVFIFFIPQQFGPHFWPLFSYVKGIRIDYLSPTVYISDILILLLFLTSYKKVFTNNQVRSFLTSSAFIFFLLILCIPFLYAKSPANVFYGMFLFIKYLYVGLFTAVIIKKEHIKPMIWIFLLTSSLESLLSVFQFFQQGSLGGIFYFVGERNIVPSSIGAAVMNTSYGLFLRPYGTFSHPNILGFYLFISSLFGLYILKTAQSKKFRLIATVLLSTTQLGIFLSFSRVIMLANIASFTTIGLLYGNVKNFRKHKITLSLLIIGVALFLIFFSNRFSNLLNFSSALVPRIDLIRISFEMFKTNPFFGTGLQNYLFTQVDFQKNFSSIYLQPVHNIYFLVIIQIGLFGFLTVSYFFCLTFLKLLRYMQKQKKKLTFTTILFVQLLCILFSGFFDHYLLTIHQGQLLLSLTLGLCWNKEVAKI